jgi:hypothetical protein
MKEPLKDKNQVFLLYTLFCGDASKTAHALGKDVNALDVAKMAEKDGWDKKVGAIAELRRSDRPGDLERAINRAVNYTDAHRYRLELQRVIDYFQSIPDEELRELLITEKFDKEGNVIGRSLSTRPFADLSSALEKAHALTYLALGDTAQDRARRKEESDSGVIAASLLNQQIIDAMNDNPAPLTQLEEAQADRAEEIALREQKFTKEDAQKDAPEPQPEFTVPPIKPKKQRMKKGRKR